MPQQELSPQSPNATKYDDDARRRLANSLRTAKKRVGTRIDNAFKRSPGSRRAPPRHQHTQRQFRKFPSVRMLKGAKLKEDEAENGGPDQLYQVVSEGQWSGEDVEGNSATFLAPDALNSFCSGSFDLSVHS